MTLAQLRKKLDELGYALTTNERDARGKKHRYRTSPNRSGGPTNYFDTKEQIERYIAHVEQIRAWQSEPLQMSAREIISNYCQGRMSGRPEFYSGRGAITSDLNSDLLEMIYKGIRAEIGAPAAMNFVQMVNDQPSLAATHFLHQLYELERNKWVWVKPLDPQVNEVAFTNELEALCTVMSFDPHRRDDTFRIRYAFLDKHREECVDCVLDKKQTFADNIYRTCYR